MPTTQKTSEKTYRTWPGGVLMQGDCLQTMRCLPKNCIDLVVTDPPYLIDYASRDGRKIQNDRTGEWLEPVFSEVYRLLKPDSFAVSFYGWTKCDRFMTAWRKAGFKIVGHLVFIKSYSSSQTFLAYRHEQAFLLAKGDPKLPEEPIPDVLEFKYTGNKLHPTQKPVKALRQLIQAFSKPGETVLDPFCGSGSTAVAARLEGREFYAVELDEGYFAKATTRLDKVAGNLTQQRKVVSLPVKRQRSASDATQRPIIRAKEAANG